MGEATVLKSTTRPSEGDSPTPAIIRPKRAEGVDPGRGEASDEGDAERDGAQATSPLPTVPEPMGSPPATPRFDVPDLIPVRMLNEYAYCPRLAYLEWVQGEFADNVYTEEGRYAHRRVDAEEGDLGEARDDNAPKVARSVMLSAPAAGLIAKIDLVEADGKNAVPVDTKRGKRPDRPEGAYEPERVQVCAQGIILRENGFECDHGILYFAGSKDRVPVLFDEPLVGRTTVLAAELRALGESGQIPEPLRDSPKCDGCSLVGICLPDETTLLAYVTADDAVREPRRLIPARDDALPVYAQDHGAYVSKSGDQLVLKKRGEKVAEARLFETSQVNIMGSVQVSTAAIQELCSRGIPICYFSGGGWFYGMTTGTLHKNVELRRHQFRAAEDPARQLTLARRFVCTKIRNCRTMLRRNAEAIEDARLRRLKDLAADAAVANSVPTLLGLEGTAARVYFESFSRMLKRPEIAGVFSFDGRNRRPPRDPVNAMLSFAYALLTKDLTIILAGAGFDPFLGFYHRPRYGRPSLALDLMEEFRPLIADSTVIGVVNTGILAPTDFVRAGGGVALKPNARKSFIEAYERRMDQLVRHPVFGYQISYRRVLDVQARLLGRHLAGEIPDYPEFATR